MLVTLSGIVIEVREVQSEKADPPMLVTLLGIVTEVSEMQPANALHPILVTLLGMVIEVRGLQAKKASSPMLVTVLGMIVLLHPAISVLVAFSIIALQFSRLSKVVLPGSTTIDVREVQSEKAPFPMLTTLLGIAIEVREKH